MDFLPLFFDLKRRPCLVVGGGSVATRKARLLHKAQARIHVVAPVVEAELAELVSASGGVLHRENFREAHLEQMVLVISATDDDAVNAEVSRLCQARQLPVNVVDDPARCSVIMPAIVDRDPLLVGITSGGESPVLARRVRSELESSIPGAYGALGKLVSAYRDEVKRVFGSEDRRRRFWESVINGDIAEKALAGDLEGARARLEQRIAARDELTKGEVYLVGAGPGDPDLLTFKALRLMQKAEVVLYDRLVSQPILDMVRRDAERIYVGKQRDQHTVPQPEINAMLLRFAQQGKRVLRLKGGDPFIFGRGGEEIDLLAEHGIPFQVVPGITAASACACYAGIPLTHRDYSQSVRFITGHTKEGEVHYPWREFIDDHQTLVFYMGLKGLPYICAQLIAHGKKPATPVALIERGTLPGQRVHLGDLSSMPALVANTEIHAPTLLIIGDVVTLHKKLAWIQTSAPQADKE